MSERDTNCSRMADTMEGVKIIPISDLLRRRRPISGAASLHIYQRPAASTINAKTLNPNATSDSKFINSLSDPSMIIGILSLPAFQASPSSNPSSGRSCFLFSDDSAAVCCDVIGFDVRIVGKKLRIVAWNFIPFKQCGGLLEIIKWEFLSHCFGTVVSFPLFSGSSDDDDVGKHSHKAKYSVYGLLESVSPACTVPCTLGNDADSDMKSTNAKNLHGFVVEILSCDCKFCKLNDCLKESDYLMQEQDGHSFSRTNFVYFRGITSSWHPAMSRLTGNVISLSGLTKKLVYVGKEEAQLMFVSTEVTCLHFSKLQNKRLQFTNAEGSIEGNGGLGVYVGVVRGIYMQGMVV